jgi:adenosylmethionine-8-amino-7-oxononanoate aminotransferase
MTTRPRKSRLARSSDAEPLELIAASGSHVFGAHRKRYIDFMSGWCVGNLGWDNEVVAKAITEFEGPDYVYPGHGYRPWEELADLLVSVAPGEMARCFRATGGSEAVDLAMQAAMVHTGRKGFLSIEGAYHGNTLATMSIGSADRKTYPNLLANCHKLKPPLHAKAVDRMETLLKGRDVAAVIMEPIAINLGAVAPDTEFVTRMRELCTKYGTLLIADEVASGFGRTGRMFACEYFDLAPDMLCIAKAVTGGQAGLGAMLATEDVAKSMEEDGEFYSTYGWHPRSTAAAIASVRYMKRHQTAILDHVNLLSEYFRQRLLEMFARQKLRLNIHGLAIGAELEDEDTANALAGEGARGGATDFSGR